MHRFLRLRTLLALILLVGLGIGGHFLYVRNKSGASDITNHPWPTLYGKAGIYGTDSSITSLDAMHEMGIDLEVAQYKFLSKTSTAELEKNHQGVVDYPDFIKYFYLCRKPDLYPTIPSCVASTTLTTTYALTQAGIDYVLNNAQTYADTTAKNPDIAAFWIVDDYPGYDVSGILKQVHTILASTGKPTICGFGGRLDQIDSSGRIVGKYRSSFLSGLVDFSSQGSNPATPYACDTVAVYPYGVNNVNDSSTIDWSMSQVMPYIKQQLTAKGWDQAKTPLIGMPHTFGYQVGGNYYVTPTAADITTQVTSYCKAGAISLLAYTWKDGVANSQELSNSADIRAGYAKGIQNCQTDWFPPVPDSSHTSAVQVATTTPTPTTHPTLTPTMTPKVTPRATPQPTAIPTPTVTPVATPIATLSPTPTPLPLPTIKPSPSGHWFDALLLLFQTLFLQPKN